MFTFTHFRRVALYLPVSAFMLLNLNAQTGNVSGSITDSSRSSALVGAQVSLSGERPLTTTTDASGHYLLLGVPAGTAKIVVRYIGLSEATKDVTVTAGSTTS